MHFWLPIFNLVLYHTAEHSRQKKNFNISARDGGDALRDVISDLNIQLETKVEKFILSFWARGISLWVIHKYASCAAFLEGAQ